MSAELHRRNITKATQSVFAAAQTMNPRFRQRYHFMAPAYWINDPNGLIRFRDQYHLFYQHNPFAPEWGPMHWGHAVSRDLVHWKHLPVALAPSEGYENDGGCFSGSAVEKDGKLFLFYTGSCLSKGKNVQVQCMAVSTDGVHFEKYPRNPVLVRQKGSPENFRDPKVWNYQNRWYMAVAASGEGGGEVLLYESEDLAKWKFRRILAQGGGKMGTMWECPDFFELSGRGVLLFSPVNFEGHKASYLTGKINRSTGIFSPAYLGETDHGFDFYAAQTLEGPAGRRVVIGWANSWDWMPWWNGFGPIQEDSWCGYMSLPREVSLCEDGKLSFRPVEELKTLRSCARTVSGVFVEAGRSFEIAAGDGVSYELIAEVDLSRSTASSFGFLLRCSGSEKTVVECDLRARELVFDRTDSDPYSRGVRRCKLDSGKNKIFLIHIFSDTCSIEIFTDQGRLALCSNIYPSADGRRNFLFAKGGGLFIQKVETWEIRKITFPYAQELVL